MGTIGYYGFLATRIAPQRLIGAAARRAARLAWNRVAPPLWPARDRLMSVLGCDSAGTLASLIARPRPCRAPWDPASLRAALSEYLPGEAERAMSRADDAARGRLALFGSRVNVWRTQGGMDWQLDPLHGGRFAAWAPSHSLPPAPGLDARIAWAVGRGEQWVALAQGAVLDSNRRRELAAALADSVHDFVAENRVGYGVQWASTAEAALRAWNLVLALWLLSAAGVAPSPDLAMDAARLLVATARFVLAHLEDDTAVPNSHLAANWLGLLACAEGLPEWPESPRWRSVAFRGLGAAIGEQVNEDGTSFEGSLSYQRLAIEIFSAAAILCHGSRRGIGRAFARKLSALFGTTRALLAAAGEIPQLGDTDAARVFALRDRAPEEGAWLLPLGAAVLRDPSLLVGPGPGDACEVAWLLGPHALRVLAASRPGPRPRSASFPNGGFHVLRRGAFEAFVSCGANGQRGIGGHSHNDKLAVELFVNRTLVVCDGGMPATTGDPELRDAYRSTRAHATIVVDGFEQAPLLPEHPLVLPDVAQARLLAFEPGGRADRLAGEHRGFARAGVIHKRELQVTESGTAVVDRLAGSGVHRIELRWPLASPSARLCRLTSEEVAAFERLLRATRVRALVDAAHGIEVPLGARRLVAAFALPAGLRPQIVPALRSPRYGLVVNATVALISGEVRCPAAFASLFVLSPVRS